ncbi:hypothetical protein BJY04DRAFT_188379 [Aspergillus karnatakaensis]|uniref:uncharacterized protein n=1 Tax=Aspergillus karnatakaensis TaxID=1810916 RepID=UPI003CCCE3A7
MTAIWPAEMVDRSCSTTARSESSETLTERTPGVSVNPPSTAEVQAPHVMPSTANVVVAKVVSCALEPPAVCVRIEELSVESTAASKPQSSIISATFSAARIVGSWWTTALPIIKLTETSPAPSTPLKAPSTAEVHAPHVIPSTLTVVVAICDVDRFGDEASPAAAIVVGTAIVLNRATKTRQKPEKTMVTA